MFRFGVYGDKAFLRAAAGGLADWCAPAGSLDALLILPEDPERFDGSVPVAVAPAERRFTAKTLIAYGLGECASVSYSSMNGDSFVLSLQREIVTLSGVRLERQELAVPPPAKPMRTLGYAAALLVAGCPPAELAGLLAQVGKN